ncbi:MULTISPECIES: sensor histidine kinase [Methylotenera]|uniref:sensor histidine kinase n=1 Tax=Methylotenera TaxID=359407 RepID=UPI00035E27AA|nr:MULTISPECIES: PAS domain S-box protein [Methylotenera]
MANSRFPKNRLSKKAAGFLSLFFFILLPVLVYSQPAYSQSVYSPQVADLNRISDLSQSPFIFAVISQAFLSQAHWLIAYKLEVTLVLFFILSLILFSLWWLNWRIKTQVKQKFLTPNQGLETLYKRISFPTKRILMIGLLFVSGLVVLYLHLVFTYQYYADQRFVQWASAGFFVFVLYGGYLFGNLKRSQQLEKLINKLHVQNVDKKIAQDKLLQSEHRLQRQNASLAHLASMQLGNWQNPEAIFREIAEVSAEALDVERVSIWRFSDDFKQLECLSLYVRSQHLHTVSQPLITEQLPEYFKHLKQNRVIAVNDVRHHAATAEFTKEYLQDNHIGAILDGTIWLNNEMIGVICHEHVGGPREWTIDEQNFVGSITDLARLTIEAQKRQQVEADLSHQQKHLETIVQKRTASIENNAKLFRFLVERAPVSILYMNIANEIIEMNPEAERISGYSREFAIGKTYQELFATKQNKQQLLQIEKQIAYGEKIQGQELSIRCADGSTADLAISRSMALDDDNNPVIISIGQDMSKQRALEVNAKKLLESEKRYSYVVEHAPLPILIIDNKGLIIEANPEAISAAGYNRATMIGENFIELIVAKESRKKAIAAAARAMKGEDFRAIELLLQNAAGEKYEYQCSIGAVGENVGDQGKLVAIALDISQQKILQASLIKAREAAESADRIKSMFVASMSHELRTPLNSIIGFLGVVLQGMSGELNFKQKDQLSRAYHSAKHLLSLITDVIDISKIEAGFLQVHIEQFELMPLLTEVEQAIEHIVTEKNLLVTIDCADGLQLETDRKRLYQVILNVASNAVKYTVKGSIYIKAQLENDWLTISVQDTGIGIGEADLAHLFKPFERIDSPLKIKTLGTGLGLYLTRKILAQLLSGTVQVQSELNEGSIFTIKIPAKISETELEQTASILDESPSGKSQS